MDFFLSKLIERGRAVCACPVCPRLRALPFPLRVNRWEGYRLWVWAHPPVCLPPWRIHGGGAAPLLCPRGLPFACCPCTHPPRGLFQVYASLVALRAMQRGGGAASG